MNNWSIDSVPFSSTERFSVFQLIVCFTADNFTVLASVLFPDAAGSRFQQQKKL